jgi:aspartyl-tRNA(Asn)/glutamyl-tRNA(Gln) amidotransferase subunit A
MTSSAELTLLSLSEAASLVARRDVSPVELTRACIERAEAVDGRLNAYFTRTFESALAEAQAAEGEIAAGRYRGPLHGVPLALKDLFETKGVVTTAGSAFRRDFVPDEDAFAVARLREAGAVFLGKLNMHEWALGATNVNELFPSPHNPWDLDRVTGGSSGGSGAALAARLCFGALGSDTRGSIRIPASLCGVTGLKPTYGRVSLRGVVPLNWSLDHAGPMARTAADCALLLNAIAGFDAADPLSIDAPAPDYAADLAGGRLEGLRIGVPRAFFFDADAVEPEVSAAVLATRAVFESLGATVVDVDFPDPVRYNAASFRAEGVAYHEERLRERPELFGRLVHRRLSGWTELSAVEYSRDRYAQYELKMHLRRLFQDVDLVLTPTTPTVAPLLAPQATEDTSNLLIRNTSIFNVAHVPAISFPCGFSASGLPIGASLAGRWWEEGVVLQGAHAYQGATGWHTRRPPID